MFVRVSFYSSDLFNIVLLDLSKVGPTSLLVIVHYYVLNLNE